MSVPRSVAVDGWFIVRALLPLSGSKEVSKLFNAWLRGGTVFYSSEVIYCEVLEQIRRLGSRGDGALLMQRAFDIFKDLPLQTASVESDLAGAWLIARIYPNIDFADAFYLTVAKDKECDLWTGNPRLVQLIGASEPCLRVIGDVSQEH